MKKRIRVGVVFGGRSAEHEVSIVSAQSVVDNLDREKYEVIPIGITQDGKWVTGGDPMKTLKAGMKLPEGAHLLQSHIPVQIANNETAMVMSNECALPVDVFFPVLHGTYGEDGSIQGLFEMLGVPYVGCSVLASALGMDKVMAKTVWTVHGLPQVKYLPVKSTEWQKDHRHIEQKVQDGIGLPCFIKPASLGSSIGVTKVKDERDIAKALDLAFQYDTTALVEQAVDAREIECAVIGNSAPEASIPGEIIPGNEFYDFADKYLEGKSRAEIPARISKEVASEVRDIACKAFAALGCSGMARVDFFLDRTSGKLYLNELNSIPGFTSISMFPKMWEASGVPYPKLLDRLIEYAMERFKQERALNRTFASESDWYTK